MQRFFRLFLKMSSKSKIDLLKSDLLKSRFQGCLVGAVLGDCLGAPFEGEIMRGGPGSYQTVIDRLKAEVNKLNKAKGDKLEYTDDTAMARCIAEFMIDHKGADQPKNFTKLAESFSVEFKNNQHRGYSYNVTPLLRNLGKPEIDVFQLAEKQFDGQGSYGNGGAMRVAPVALQKVNDIDPEDSTKDHQYDQIIQDAKDSARLTHSHELGYNGAIVQALAVHLALHTEKDEIDPVKFTENLLELVKNNVENNTEEKIYSEKLGKVKCFLGDKEGDVKPKTVVEELGNSISAPKSVVTAVYSFLRCLSEVKGLSTDNLFERTILYAISLGGDTDTIASMAGAIAGAYHGYEMVATAGFYHGSGEEKKYWVTACEGSEDAKEEAEKLFDIYKNKLKSPGMG